MTFLLDTSLWIDFTPTRSPVPLKQFIASYVLDPEAHLAEPVRIGVLRSARSEEARLLEAQFVTLPCLATPDSPGSGRLTWARPAGPGGHAPSGAQPRWRAWSSVQAGQRLVRCAPWAIRPRCSWQVSRGMQLAPAWWRHQWQVMQAWRLRLACSTS